MFAVAQYLTSLNIFPFMDASGKRFFFSICGWNKLSVGRQHQHTEKKALRTSKWLRINGVNIFWGRLTPLDAVSDLKNEKMNDELWPALLLNTDSFFSVFFLFCVPFRCCFYFLLRLGSPLFSHSRSLPKIHYDRRFINRSNHTCSHQMIYFSFLFRRGRARCCSTARHWLVRWNFRRPSSCWGSL